MTAELIKHLQNPSLYDHSVEQFQVIETHISWVILTGAYAYKIKKPMDFGFLNFTQLADRQFFCQEELRLNQRLTKDIYLEVLPITGTLSEPKIGGNGEPIEYMLKMRQFPQSQILSHLQSNGELIVGHIDQLSKQIAEFHMTTPVVAAGNELGSPETVMAPVKQNFEQIRAMLPADKAGYKQLEELEAWAQSSYERLKPILVERKANGFIRECHGDIHLNNAAILDSKVVIFDCIEFNEPFRFTDVTADIAFLIMDLEDRKLNGFANRLLNNYLEETGDYQSLLLMNFYKAYRAMVRAKVALFSLGQTTDQGVKEAILKQYYNYANLAERYTLLPPRYLLITNGVSAVGKSYVSSKVVEHFGAIRLRSDKERKRLLGDGATLEALYSAEATIATYNRLYQLAKDCLQAGYGVILDAAYLKKTERAKAKLVAEEVGVPFLIIECEAPLAVIEKNLSTRIQKGNDPSDATLEVVKNQLQWREPITGEERSITVKVETDKEESIHSLIEYINHYFKFDRNKY